MTDTIPSDRRLAGFCTQSQAGAQRAGLIHGPGSTTFEMCPDIEEVTHWGTRFTFSVRCTCCAACRMSCQARKDARDARRAKNKANAMSCNGCGQAGSYPPHLCPFNMSSGERCNCCEKCSRECAADE